MVFDLASRYIVIAEGDGIAETLRKMITLNGIFEEQGAQRVSIKQPVISVKSVLSESGGEGTTKTNIAAPGVGKVVVAIGDPHADLVIVP